MRAGSLRGSILWGPVTSRPRQWRQCMYGDRRKDLEIPNVECIGQSSFTESSSHLPVSEWYETSGATRGDAGFNMRSAGHQDLYR